MKYLLIAETDDNNRTFQVFIFENEEQRIKQTLQLIFGNPEDESIEAQYTIELLKEEHRISFEGDPSIEWIDAISVCDSNKKFL